MPSELSVNFTLTLNEAERMELLRILETVLVETHAETRRTEAPAYQEQMHQKETLLRNLTEKVRRLGQ